MLLCHHVFLVAIIAVAPNPSRKSARATFVARDSVSIELRRDWRHLLGDNAVDRSCGVFKSKFVLHTSLSNKNGEFYELCRMTYP